MIESSLAIDSADVAEHYDDLDGYYRQFWGEHLHHGFWETGSESPQQAIESLIQRVARPLGLAAGASVCDVGCGYGGTSRYLASRQSYRMTGLTISQQQYDFAVSKLGGADNPRFLLCNWETNSLPDGSFDGLLSIECIGHVMNKDRFFQEIYRVLKPGGRACITAWLSSEHAGRRARRWLLQPICREGRLPSMGTASEYTLLAESSQLRQLCCEDLTGAVQKTWAICLWRVFVFLFFSRAGWRFLFSSKSRHAVFVFSIARIWIAYRVGAMEYGVFEFEKPLT
ncbi:Demethylrebeccamycin-D-glucose O-methyltransferase [Rosistilla ulvae]|uniref:Demethylrebeccamycin-D-glucose O-methyltransferase n=1 Tax=Rosistilla ulvae TaxID=1930277 RepID=A0A517M3N4_9BACT|nr:class I SAM-dependent methyltransferase [Rosistilla ulvae]QDS89483.1 Demethylrebeccamycin-D-glucose O-methyltransferase [Rosistilla ulvae]